MLQELIEKIEKEIKERHDAIEYAKKLPINELAEAFPAGKWNYDWIGRFEFALPYSFELIEKVKAEVVKFAEIRNTTTHVWSDKEAGYFISCKSVGGYFEINFRTTREGTTCVLNKIGEEVITKPIYEVICSQAAADEF